MQAPAVAGPACGNRGCGMLSSCAMATLRTILHVDLDAFYASVEQRDDPALRGRPIVVGGDSDRGVVSAASYEARAFGIRSAMPMVEAKRRCAALVVVPGRMRHYAEVSRQIRAIFHRYTPIVEPLSLDEAFLDVTGSRGLFGDGPTIAAAIRHAIRDELALTASAGVATNKLIAKVASDVDKPDGLTVVAPGDEARFLAPMPIERLWGVGPKTAASFRRRGLTTIGSLQAWWPADRPLAALPDRMRVRGLPVELYRRAFGIDDRPVSTDRRAKSISSEHTFGEDHPLDDTVRTRLRAEAEAVARRLRAAGWRSRTVQLKLRTDRRGDDGRHRTITRAHTVAAPTDDAMTLYHVALALAERLDLGDERIRLVGLGASGLSRDHQAGLFDDDDGDGAPELNAALDRITTRWGDGSVRPASTLRTGLDRGAANADDLA